MIRLLKRDPAAQIVLENPELSMPVVNAILLNNGQYLLQQRSLLPNISEPGAWGLFGGSRKPFEHHRAAIARELYEELALRNVRLDGFGMTDHSVIFTGDITVAFHEIRLGEGRGYGSFTMEECRSLSSISPTTLSILEAHDAELSRP